MNATQLLETLEAGGVRLVPSGDRLKYHPASAVPPDLVPRIRELKAELIDLLRQRIDAMLRAVGTGPDWRHVRRADGREMLVHRDFKPERWIER